MIGETEDGIFVAASANVTVTTGNVTGKQIGIVVETNSRGGGSCSGSVCGKYEVDMVLGGSNAAIVPTTGIVIDSTSGAVEGTTGIGISAVNSSYGGTSVTTADVTGGSIGILANARNGDVTIDSTKGTVKGEHLLGIGAFTGDGNHDIDVKTADVTSSSVGVAAANNFNIGRYTYSVSSLSTEKATVEPGPVGTISVDTTAGSVTITDPEDSEFLPSFVGGIGLPRGIDGTGVAVSNQHYADTTSTTVKTANVTGRSYGINSYSYGGSVSIDSSAGTVLANGFIGPIFQKLPDEQARASAALEAPKAFGIGIAARHSGAGDVTITSGAVTGASIGIAVSNRRSDTTVNSTAGAVSGLNGDGIQIDATGKVDVQSADVTSKNGNGITVRQSDGKLKPMYVILGDKNAADASAEEAPTDRTITIDSSAGTVVATLDVPEMPEGEVDYPMPPSVYYDEGYYYSRPQVVGAGIYAASEAGSDINITTADVTGETSGIVALTDNGGKVNVSSVGSGEAAATVTSKSGAGVLGQTSGNIDISTGNVTSANGVAVWGRHTVESIEIPRDPLFDRYLDDVAMGENGKVTVDTTAGAVVSTFDPSAENVFSYDLSQDANGIGVAATSELSGDIDIKTGDVTAYGYGVIGASEYGDITISTKGSGETAATVTTTAGTGVTSNGLGNVDITTGNVDATGGVGVMVQHRSVFSSRYSSANSEIESASANSRVLAAPVKIKPTTINVDTTAGTVTAKVRPYVPVLPTESVSDRGYAQGTGIFVTDGTGAATTINTGDVTADHTGIYANLRYGGDLTVTTTGTGETPATITAKSGAGISVETAADVTVTTGNVDATNGPGVQVNHAAPLTNYRGAGLSSAALVEDSTPSEIKIDTTAGSVSAKNAQKVLAVRERALENISFTRAIGVTAYSRNGANIDIKTANVTADSSGVMADTSGKVSIDTTKGAVTAGEDGVFASGNGLTITTGDVSGGDDAVRALNNSSDAMLIEVQGRIFTMAKGDGNSGINFTSTQGASNAVKIGADATVTSVADLAISGNVGTGAVSVTNEGIIDGLVSIRAGSGSFENAAKGIINLRNFSDTDHNLIRDHKGIANSALDNLDFDNKGVIRLVSAGDVTGYSADTTDDTAPITFDSFTPTNFAGHNVQALSVSGVSYGGITGIKSFSHSGGIILQDQLSGGTSAVAGDLMYIGRSEGLQAGASTTGNALFTSNGGSLYIDTVLNDGVSDTTDMLVLDATATGSGATQVFVVNAGGLGGDTDTNQDGEWTFGEGIKIIDVLDTSASASDAFVLSGSLVADKYEYTLQFDSTDGDWYLASKLRPQNEAAYETIPSWMMGVIHLQDLLGRQNSKIFARPSGGGAGGGIGVAALSYGDVIGQSAGSLIPSTATRSGVWFNINTGLADSNPTASTSGASYKASALGFELGFDKPVKFTDNGIYTATAYAMVGKTHVDSPSATTFDSAETRHYGAGIGLTYYDKSGFYIDGQLQSQRYVIDIVDSSGVDLASNVSGSGIGGSIEFGKSFVANDGWLITPQAQLSYTSVQFDPFTDSNNVAVSLAEAHSLESRLGLFTSKESVDKSGNKTKFFAGFNLYHEFNNETVVDVAGNMLTYKTDPWRGEISIGGTVELNGGKTVVFGNASTASSLKNFGDSTNIKGSIGVKVSW